MGNSIWNWPNRLTVSRLAVTVLFVVAMTGGIPFPHTAALVLFSIASATDWLDGMLARRLGLVTDFGKLMDPLADKVLMASALICLVPSGAIPAWVVVVVIGREFLITGLRLLALSKGVLLPAESLGKHKTVWQAVTAIFFLGMLASAELFGGWAGTVAWSLVWMWGGTGCIAATVALTLFSGLGYFWKHRELVLGP
jgi:CDP-diacylglycerol--glycerol-3-phosphate 3-phosphatidyltransferase